MDAMERAEVEARIRVLKVEAAVLDELVALKESQRWANRAVGKLTVMALGDLGDQAQRAEVQSADVVLGFDVSRRHRVVMYGREVFEGLALCAGPPVRAAAVAYDQESGDELEYLVAAVQVLKGCCEYRAGGVG